MSSFENHFFLFSISNRSIFFMNQNRFVRPTRKKKVRAAATRDHRIKKNRLKFVLGFSLIIRSHLNWFQFSESWVLPSFFFIIYSSLTAFQRICNELFHVFTSSHLFFFHQWLISFSFQYSCFIDSTGITAMKRVSYRVLLGFHRFYTVSPSFIWFLLGFSGFDELLLR